MSKGTWILLLVVAAFWAGRGLARGDPEVTRLDRLEATRITLRSEDRSLVLSPEGVWCETRDGKVAYLEADKVVLADRAGGQRRPLVSLVADPLDGSSALVFHGEGGHPRCLVQSGPSGSGLTTLGADGTPRLLVASKGEASRIELHDGEGRVRARVLVEPAAGPARHDPARAEASFAVLDERGEVQARLP